MVLCEQKKNSSNAKMRRQYITYTNFSFIPVFVLYGRDAEVLRWKAMIRLPEELYPQKAYHISTFKPTFNLN